MESAEIPLVCGLKVWVACQDRLRGNLDADKILAQRFSDHESRSNGGSPRLYELVIDTSRTHSVCFIVEPRLK